MLHLTRDLAGREPRVFSFTIDFESRKTRTEPIESRRELDEAACAWPPRSRRGKIPSGESLETG